MIRFISGEIEALLFRCNWHRDSHFTLATLLEPVRQLTPNLQMGDRRQARIFREALSKSVRGEFFPFVSSIRRAASGTQGERKMYRTIVMDLFRAFLARSLPQWA